jgi:hypothetical protein
MQVFWAEYGFFLWGLTTALAIIALAWLAWSTFSQSSDEDEEAAPPEADPAPAEMVAQVQELAEGAPLMRASLGRALQFVGLERYVDTTGAPAFALAVASARGDGFILVSSVRGGLTAKPILAWGPAPKALFSAEEQLAVEQARAQLERKS